jgi:hypothetical protein
MGIDVRTLYDKEFLYSFDLQGRDVTVVIERVKAGVLTGVGGKKNKKPVVYFRGKEKGLGLNITNARTIASMYGGFDAEKWIGKAVTLYPTTTTFGDKTVDCIRVRPEIPRPAGRGQPQASDIEDEDARNRRLAEPTEDEVAK